MPVATRETSDQNELLEGLVNTFQADPDLSRKSMHELLQMDPRRFARTAFHVLIATLTPAHQYLLLLLMLDVNEAGVIDFLMDTSNVELSRARDTAIWLSRVDQNLGAKLLKYLIQEKCIDDGDNDRIERALELLTVLPDSRLSTPHLLELLRSSNTRVQSKATLLMARSKQEPRWAEVRLSEADPRVRANAIEGLWNVHQPGIEQVLRAATRDTNHRVAVNAWIGLNYLGDPQAVDGLVNLAAHQNPFFRSAAAWGMGHLGEPIFQPVLQKMVRDENGMVRRNALRGLVRIRKKHEVVEPPELARAG